MRILKLRCYTSWCLLQPVSVLRQCVHGYTVNGGQCKNKFNALVTAYKKAKDHNKSGNDPATCPFFSEFDQLLDSKPNVTPVAAGSNRRRPASVSASNTHSDEEQESASQVPQKDQKVGREKLIGLT